jgi:integrase
MHAIFSHAMRWELFNQNPISFVRQSAKRARVPDVLTAEEIGKLLGKLSDPWRTAVYIAVTTGLRVSELLALKWADLDFAAGEIAGVDVVRTIKIWITSSAVPTCTALNRTGPALRWKTTSARLRSKQRFRSGLVGTRCAIRLGLWSKARARTLQPHKHCCDTQTSASQWTVTFRR